MPLSARLTIAMVSLVLFTAAVVSLLIYRSLEAAIIPRAIERVESHVTLLAEQLDVFSRSAREDVAATRSSAAVKDLVAAMAGDVTGAIEGGDASTWAQRVAAGFARELEAKPVYAQLRLIGAADGGREIVRVDRSGADGAVRIVPAAELPRDADRDYFQRTIDLPADRIFVSRIELSRRDGAVVTPHVPTLHVAAPVRGPDGAPFGVLALNLDMREMFAAIRAEARPGGRMFVVDDQGDFLLHPDPGREFAYEFGHPARWQDEFPALAAALGPGRSGARVVPDQDGAHGGAAIAYVRPAGGPSVGVMEFVPNATIMGPVQAVRRSSLLAALATAPLALLFAILLARSLAKPLVEMTRAVEGFARDQAIAVPERAGGEIGVLARAFARVGAQVHEQRAALEREIEKHRRASAEEQRSRQALRESEQMAREVINTALDAVVQMDDSGRVMEWSPQAEALFQWPRAQAVGRTLADLILPASSRDRYHDAIAAIVHAADGATAGRRFEITALRRDGGEITVEIAVSALRRGEGCVFNGFIRDLTAKIAAEEQLRQAQKLEAVGQLTGGVAHDFNNILTVITGTIEILGDAVRDRPDLAAITRMIDQAADRGTELTKHLLAFARKQPLRPRDTDINTLIVDANKLLQPTLGEQIEIEALLEDDVRPALVDSAQLTAALLNLAINARDAMPRGGKLIIETSNVRLGASYARLHGDVAEGPYVLIAVSDTGSGIAPAILDKVFEPFFTTKESGKGTGLGLSMVYGFVKQSGGHIKIYSEERHGTTVKIYLPWAPSVLAAETDGGAAAGLERGSETILVVEDDPMVRGYVTAQLQSLGYTTVAAANGAEALALIDRGAAFELLFTDVIMPGGMNGRELAIEAAKRRKNLKVLFTSGYTENAVLHHGRLDPGVLLLAKPYRKSDLARMIRTALGAAVA